MSSYGRYVDVEVTFEVLAKVNTKKLKDVLATYKCEVACVKHEMYDQYEYGSLDVSEYDYEEKEIGQPLYPDEFTIVTADSKKLYKAEELVEIKLPDGTTYDYSDDEIVEVVEVLDYDFEDEHVIGTCEQDYD